MKSILFRQVVLSVLMVTLVGALLVGGWAHAAAAQFTQRERIALAMDNSPELIVAALESVLTQAQLDAVESALFPEPTEAEKRAALESVKEKLLQAGFAVDDSLVVAIDARADEIVVEAQTAQE